MKVGDLVRLSAEPSVQQVWTIVAIKSDSRGLWIQFECSPADHWYESSHYEVVFPDGVTE